MTDHDESALARWSRRKREASAAAKAGMDRQDAKPDVAKEAPPNTESSSESRAEEAEPQVSVEDLPDVETLTYESDFTVFLQRGVPDALRSMALAKLWRSDPILANLDGLNDYDDDYRIVAQTDGPLMKLIEPESRAELSLEREKRLSHRERDRHDEPRRVEQRRNTNDSVASSGTREDSNLPEEASCDDLDRDEACPSRQSGNAS
jgi:hypothetical protein